MVASFADMLHARYSSMGGASRILIVYEPSVDSGYPDLVVLRYTQTFMKHWDDTRCKLGNTDLKVLSFLLSNHASTEGIAKTLGFSAKAIDASISRLAESSLVFKEGNEWRSYKRDRVFGIKEIVSHEAKMQSASCVHRQAVMNKRFSSSSYAILFSKRPTTTTKSLFAKTGILSSTLVDCRKIQKHRPKFRPVKNTDRRRTAIWQFDSCEGCCAVTGSTPKKPIYCKRKPR